MSSSAKTQRHLHIFLTAGEELMTCRVKMLRTSHQFSHCSLTPRMTWQYLAFQNPIVNIAAVLDLSKLSGEFLANLSISRFESLIFGAS